MVSGVLLYAVVDLDILKAVLTLKITTAQIRRLKAEEGCNQLI